MNKLFRHTWFPLAFQLLALAVFVLLIIGGLLADTNDPAFAKVLRNTNLANLVVWSYWWPLIILASPLLGRVWCLVCPMELVTSLAARIGLKRKPPAVLRSGWVMTGFYVLILFIGIHTLSIHRVPYRMAVYMLILFATALVSGLLFSRNAFCAHVCPVGHLLGLYARLAPFGWGVRDKSTCKTCDDKSCIAKQTAYDFQSRSCGVGLAPSVMHDSTACILCGHCLKACDRYDPGTPGRPNPGWFRRPWFKDLLDLKPMTSAQAIFCLIVSGFVVYEVFTEWSVTKTLLLWTPNQIAQSLGLAGAGTFGLVKSLTLFVLLPTVFWMLPYGLFRLAGGRLPVVDYLRRFGLAFIPIMAATHIVKALLKMTSRIPYWEHVAVDPLGIDTASGLIDKTLQLTPPPAWIGTVITIISLVLMGIAIVLSIVMTRKLIAVHATGSGGRALLLLLIPVIYGGGFAAMLIAWRLIAA